MRRARSNARANVPTALVIEVNPGYRSAICQAVESAGGQCESVADLRLAKGQIDGSKKFDIVIVGTSADSPLTPLQVRNLRSAAQSPLIVLAESYDETRDTLEVYKAGADQVLPKPFVPDALIGAIKAEVRRPGPVSLVPLARRIELGRLGFDSDQRQVCSKDRTVQLTRREWQLLSVLLASPNRFFTAGEVAAQAWGPDASAEQFRGYVSRIRRKLSPFSGYCRLITQKGQGYALAVEPTA